MYKLSKIHPIQMNDLIRIGNKGDGGYVLSKSQIDKTNILLSFGVNDDWSFEEGFKNRQNITCHAFDYSVKKWKFSKIGILMQLIRNRFSKNSRINAMFQIKHSFYKFFDDKNGFFHKKFLGFADDERNVSVPSLFSKILPKSIDDLSVFVKMDIEQSEFRTLPCFEPYYRYINGFVIEFHDLDILGQNFVKETERLLNDFYIAHVSANDCTGYIPGTKLPRLLEITFINKALVSGIPQNSSSEYPIKGLDFLTKPGYEQLHLDFGG